MTNFTPEWMTLIGSMVSGGVIYSLISFSYMHKNFTTSERMKRSEDATSKIFDELRAINEKLNKLIGKLDK